METLNKYLKHLAEEYKNKLKLGCNSRGREKENIMKMTQTINGTERTFYLVDGEMTTKIVKFQKDHQKRLVAVLPENSIGKLTFNLGKMIEEDITEIEISDSSSKAMRDCITTTTKIKPIKHSIIEELLKERYPEIYKELEEAVKRKSIEKEIERLKALQKELEAKIRGEA